MAYINGKRVLFANVNLGASTVVANPTLDGSEDKLEAVTIDGVNYSVGDVGELEITYEQAMEALSGSVQLTQSQVDYILKFSVLDITTIVNGAKQTLYKNITVEQGENGKPLLRLVYADPDGATTLYSYVNENNILYIQFYDIKSISGSSPESYLDIGGIGRVYTLPTVTASDAGKILTVNASGVWVATAIPNAEDTNF